ncbi:DUF6943 family protein [Wenyingzhuangia sp. 2_MG-2023]|uniref:DUF6943 family protein n=1 Tax=Wenyingzhuangia sp. 2_MG-2023 TaxID=3062639 RepID=UPI0038B450DF
MLNFEIKTYQKGQNYREPHFFILNKGLNSGKPLLRSCCNCFVIMTRTENDKNKLFSLSMMLQIGGYFKYHLRGSVIPFINIKDCSNTLKKGITATLEVDKHIQIVEVLQKEQTRLSENLEKIKQMKKAYIQACFKYHPVE